MIPTTTARPMAQGQWLHARVGEVRVCLQSDADWITSEFADLYPESSFGGSPADDDIRMEVRGGGRSRLGRQLYQVYADGEVVAGPRTRVELFPFLEWGINLRVIARYSQYLQLHAASLACAGAGCVFAGGSGCGKSTLAAGLLARGWDYLCDEFALIEPGHLSLHPFPKALCIKAGSFLAVADLGLRLMQQRHYVKGLKGRVRYIKPSATVAATPIRYVIFPKYTAGAAPRISKISPGRAFLDLAGCIFNRSHFADDGLPVLADVVRRVDCFRLETGDLEKTCAILEAQLGIQPQRPPSKYALATRSTPVCPTITQPALPSRRDAIRIGTRLAYIVPAVMTFSAREAFAQASNPSGICSTGVQTGGLCESDADCCSRQCSLGVCE